MRIVIDATPVVERRKGIGVVLAGLISSIRPGMALSNARLLVDETFSRANPGFFGRMEIEPVAFRSSLWFESVQIPRLLSRSRADVFLTLRERTLVPRATRSVVWLFEDPARRHALAARSGNHGLSQRLVGWHAGARLSRNARRVDRFVVSSQFTRQDLIDSYGVGDDRISIVHPGIDAAFFLAEAGPLRSNAAGGHRYVVHFATGDPRDNTVTAMRAFGIASRENPAVHLVLAGVPQAQRPHIAQTASSLDIEARTHILPYLPATRMPELYAGADAYLDPTLFEGFGLQILEAMAAGAPVVTSDVASVPEVAGGTAVLCDPMDVEGIARELSALLADPVRRARVAASGRSHASNFRWGKTVEEVERLIRRP